VIEMKEREREEIKRLAKEPLPDVEKLLSELEQRLEALESKGPLPIEVEIWVRGARDSLALLREQIVLELTTGCGFFFFWRKKISARGAGSKK
jgi:hypothetical protein